MWAGGPQFDANVGLGALAPLSSFLCRFPLFHDALLCVSCKIQRECENTVGTGAATCSKLGVSSPGMYKSRILFSFHAHSLSFGILQKKNVSVGPDAITFTDVIK